MIFPLLRQDHCLGDTTSTFELHYILYISLSFSPGGASHKSHAEMHVKHCPEDSRLSSSYTFGHFKIPMTQTAGSNKKLHHCKFLMGVRFFQPDASAR